MDHIVVADLVTACMSISTLSGVVSCRSWQKSPKISKKTRYVGSRSSRVIVFGTNRTGIIPLPI